MRLMIYILDHPPHKPQFKHKYLLFIIIKKYQALLLMHINAISSMKKSTSVDSLVSQPPKKKTTHNNTIIPKTMKKSVSMDNLKNYNVTEKAFVLVKSSAPSFLYDIIKDHDVTHIGHILSDHIQQDVVLQTLKHIM